MTVTKSQKRLFVVLAIVVAYAAVDFMMNREDYEQTYTKGKTTDQANSSTSRLIAKTRITATPPDLTWGRDPFSRGTVKAKIRRQKQAPQVKLVLNAITFSEENSIAIINDEILQHGDMIEGYVVEQITADAVVLKSKDRTVKLKSR